MNREANSDNDAIDPGVYSQADDYEAYANELLEDDSFAPDVPQPVQQRKSDEELRAEAEAFQKTESKDEETDELLTNDDEETVETAAEAEQEQTEASEKEEPVTPDYDEIRKRLQQRVEEERAAKEVQAQQVGEAEETEQPELPNMDDLRQQVMQETEARFQLSEDEVELLREDPNQVLPKLFSKMFLETFDSLMTGLNKQIPQQVAQIIDFKQRTQEGSNLFYGTWPQLNKPGLREIVDRVSDAYASTNAKTLDQIPLDQRIMEIGAQAWIAAKLPIGDLQKHIDSVLPPQSEPQQAAPKQQQVQMRQPGQGFTPGSTRKAAAPKNDFEILAEEFLDEDAS